MRGKRDGWTLSVSYLWRRLHAAEGVEDLDKFCVASLTSVSDKQHK